MVGHDANGFATQTGAARTENVIASAARLEAGGTIGVAGNPLDTAVATLAARAGTGSAYVYESDGLSIGSVAPVSVEPGRSEFDGDTVGRRRGNCRE